MIKRYRQREKPKCTSLLKFLSTASMLFMFVLLYLASTYSPSWLFNYAAIRPELRDTVQAISKCNFISSGVIGYSAKRPHQWDRRRWLRKNASTLELEKLIHHPSASVKASVYEALLKRPYRDKHFLVIQAMQDSTSRITYFSGCIGLGMTVGEHLVKNVLFLSNPKYINKRQTMERFDLTEEEIDDIYKIYNSKYNEHLGY